MSVNTGKMNLSQEIECKLTTFWVWLYGPDESNFHTMCTAHLLSVLFLVPLIKLQASAFSSIIQFGNKNCGINELI